MLNFNDFFENLKKIEAHPGENLKDHIKWVANECKLKGRNVVEKEFLYFAGIFHDAGKYTNIFQYYLAGGPTTNDNIDVIDLIDKYKQHAVFGAFLFFWFYLYNNDYFKSFHYKYKLTKLIPEDLLKSYMLAGFYAILKHHGDLGNVNDCLDINWLNNKINIVRKQCDYVNIEIFENEYKELFGDLLLTIKFDKFKEFVFNNKLSSYIINFIEEIITNKSYNNYMIFKHFYSSLIYADKYKTICQESEYNKLNNNCLDGNLVDEFRLIKGYDKPDSDLNIFRNKIYSDVSEVINNIDLEQHFYTLNSPTGSGKTFNLINIGLKLKEKLNKKGFSLKIIYGLPFTSIIDQVYEEVKNILKLNGVYDPTILTKHHSLAENNFDNESENILTDNYSVQKLFIESWESDIVVTTFFQIFHSMFGNQNKRLIKFPNFQNTIFLLDEIQSTPYKYRGNFKEMFEILAKNYNCYFVLSSATLPLIFDKGQSVELLPNYISYFQQMDRTQLDLSFLNKESTIQEMYDEIKKSLNNNERKHHLITLNTIKSSLKIFEKIKNDFDNPNNNLIYLSTNIIPKHRKQRIQEIKDETNKENGKRVILISTQMIEAGVDIDLDIGFRDIGPIDSVIQILGRLNRNGKKKEKGILKLFKLIDEDNKKLKLFSSYIYNTLVMNLTDNLLQKEGKLIIDEKNYKELFDIYFNLINENKSKTTEIKINDDIKLLNYESINEGFKLIENIYQTIDIFVMIDDQAKEIWNEREIIKKSYDDKRKKREKLQKIKKEFGQYIISVDIKKAQKCGFDKKQLEIGLVCLKDELLETYYKEDIGFTVIDKNQDLLEDNFI